MSLLTDIVGRLGEAFHGSNMDLTPLPQESSDKSGGGSDGDDGEETEESKDSGGESEDEAEDSEESEAAGSDDEAEDDEAEDDGADADGAGDADDVEDGDDEDGSESAGSEDAGDDEDADEDADGSGGESEDDADDADADDADADDADGDDDTDDADGDDEGDSDDGSDKDADKDDGGDTDPSAEEKDAGGHDVAATEDSVFTDEILDALRDPSQWGIKDLAEAMKEAVLENMDDECLANEMVWRPQYPTQDKLIRPRGDVYRADRLLDAAAPLVAGIRSQYRRKFLEARRPVIFHGVRRGRDLSERRMVDTMVEIRSGVRPSRPDYRIKKGDDCSLALAVVGDQSGSMGGQNAHYAAMAMIALADSFESLGSPVMCCGVRNGNWDTKSYWNEPTKWDDSVQFHRSHPIIIDEFKGWDESMKKKQVRGRFSAYKATGSTPLSDGVQYALESISERPERHRVIVVLTDGAPDNARAMRRLIRIAREAGIWVVGVGIGYGMDRVHDLFVDKAVVCEDPSTMPRDLLSVLESIVFPKRGGARAALDGKTGLLGR